MERDYRRPSSSSNTDDPPLSRLFIIGPKTLTEADYRKHFTEFGTIEELWMVKDKMTGDYKGVTYIKYAKTSQAAKALEAMNGSSLIDGTKRIKVMIAASRDQGSRRDTNEEEKMQRLFIVCPRSATDDELHDYFKQFGNLDYVSILKDRATRESKGVAYVKYHKFSHAAKAFEECDRKYKPVFAEPKGSDNNRKSDSRDMFNNPSTSFLSGNSSVRNFSMFSNNALLPPPTNEEGFTKLRVIASPDLNQDQLWKLFDVVPGMDYCQLRYEGAMTRPFRAVAEVVYSNPQWAAHARDKLHGFEYPPGFRLIVKPIFGGEGPRTPEKPGKDLLHIAETLKQATSIIEAAGINPAALLNLGNLTKHSTLDCNVSLPPPKPLAGIDEECAARCFVVGTEPLPKQVMQDLFCRFGNLLDAYMLPNKNYGYVRYTDRTSAENAMQTLHGAEVNNVKLKVLKAEEQRKRLKTDDN